MGFVYEKTIPERLKDRIVIETQPYLHYPEKVKQEAEDRKKELMKKVTFSFLEDSESVARRKKLLNESENKKINYFQPIEERIAEKKFRSYLVGDNNGFIRFASLDSL